MSRHALAISILAAMLAPAAHADTIDACSLLSETELVELGLPKDSVASRESQPGGVRACHYRFRPPGADSDATVSIILSQSVPERALQLRALQAKVLEESTAAQRQARGEYVEGPVMCKVVSVPPQEVSQCVGATEQSVVALAWSRTRPADAAVNPATPLRIVAALLSRVKSQGG